MIAAIVNRAQRRLAGAAATELDHQQSGPRPKSDPATFKNNSIASTKTFHRRRNAMLTQAQRTTILELHKQGVGKREIARVLGISRVAVRKVLRSNSTAVPELQRPEKGRTIPATDPGTFRASARGISCESMRNWLASGAELSYAALTAFCRRHGIGYASAGAGGPL